MALKRLVERTLPAPEPLDEKTMVEQVLDMPMFIPVRLFWDNLLTLRPWWPVLLPLLAYTGLRAYTRERRVVQARAAARAAIESAQH